MNCEMRPDASCWRVADIQFSQCDKKRGSGAGNTHAGPQTFCDINALTKYCDCIVPPRFSFNPTKIKDNVHSLNPGTSLTGPGASSDLSRSSDTGQSQELRRLGPGDTSSCSSLHSETYKLSAWPPSSRAELLQRWC